jgi:hypothetical protein
VLSLQVICRQPIALVRVIDRMLQATTLVLACLVLGNVHGRQVQLQNDAVDAAKSLAVALMSLHTPKRKADVGRRNFVSKAAALGSVFGFSSRKPAFAEELPDDEATLRELRELVPELRALLPQLRQRLDEDSNPSGRADPEAESAMKTMDGAEAVAIEPFYAENLRSESSSAADLKIDSAIKIEDPIEATPRERSIVTDPQAKVVMTLDDRIEAMARQVRETKLETESADRTGNVQPDRVLESVPAVVGAASDEVDLRTPAEAKSGLSVASSQQQVLDNIHFKYADAPEGGLKVPIMGALGVLALRQVVEELRSAETKESEDEQVPAEADSPAQEQVEAGTEEMGRSSEIVDLLKERAKAAGRVTGQHIAEVNRFGAKLLTGVYELKHIPEPESESTLTLDPEAEAAKNAQTFNKYGGYLKDANMDTESYLRSLGIGSPSEEQGQPQIMETSGPEIESDKESDIASSIYENYMRDASLDSTESYLRSLEARESTPGHLAEDLEIFSDRRTRNPSHEYLAERSDSSVGSRDQHLPPERAGESEFIEITGPSKNFANPRSGDQDPHWRWRSSEEKRKDVGRTEPHSSSELEPVIETFDEQLRRIAAEELAGHSAKDLIGTHDRHPSHPTHKQRRQSEFTETLDPRSNLAKALFDKDDHPTHASRRSSYFPDWSTNHEEHLNAPTGFAEYMKYKQSKPPPDSHRQPEPETYSHADYSDDYREE